MTRRHLRPATVLTMLAALALVATGCSGDDDASPATSGGGSATTIELSTKVSSDWGALADCPIGPQSADPGGSPADEGVDGALDFGDQTQDHVEDCVDYPVHPAVGGSHYPVWANCGFYTSPVPEEAAVHVLEHGGVWIAFDPDLGADDLSVVRTAADASTHILANPYPGLTSKLVLTAWSRQLTLDSASDPRFQKFIDTYLQGPNTPELGAPCNGGIGSPEPKA